MIIGLDEVGRGSWAGPLLFAAVALATEVPGLRDSKKLAPKVRQELYLEIKKNANFIGYGWVHSHEIDSVGLAVALRLAAERSVEGISKHERKNKIVVDGNIDYLGWKNSGSLVKADDQVPEVSAASIMAKVARDNLMKRYDLLYPNYGFKNNVGYGTAQHAKALKRHGVTKNHRLSFKPVQFIHEKYPGRKTSRDYRS
ncbi:MAG: ribonuclease HII [Candidatus Saccharimonadales bacterium]|nr:ribonuclease HII [Candidatus Saccharimonadales bacterium]